MSYVSSQEQNAERVHCFPRSKRVLPRRNATWTPLLCLTTATVCDSDPVTHRGFSFYSYCHGSVHTRRCPLTQTICGSTWVITDQINMQPANNHRVCFFLPLRRVIAAVQPDRRFLILCKTGPVIIALQLNSSPFSYLYHSVSVPVCAAVLQCSKTLLLCYH